MKTIHARIQGNRTVCWFEPTDKDLPIDWFKSHKDIVQSGNLNGVPFCPVCSSHILGTKKVGRCDRCEDRAVLYENPTVDVMFTWLCKECLEQVQIQSK